MIFWCKGTVHPKINSLSLFTNLYDCLLFCGAQKEMFLVASGYTENEYE